MKKFSKSQNSSNIRKKKVEELYKDEHVTVIKYENWSIIDDRDCVICIPYFIENGNILLRNEYIPSFKYKDSKEYHVSLVGGGVEDDETPEEALRRELEEEAGISLRDGYRIEFEKPLFKTKGNSSKYHIAILNLTENDYHETIPRTDGTREEKLAQNIKFNTKYLNTIKSSDILTEYVLLLFKRYTIK